MRIRVLFLAVLAAGVIPLPDCEADGLELAHEADAYGEAFERIVAQVRLWPEFKFDAKTPPMPLLHGDDDYYSSMGPVKLYEELHRRKIPAQLVVYSNASHGLNHNANVRGWERRIIDWIESRGC